MCSKLFFYIEELLLLLERFNKFGMLFDYYTKESAKI